MGGREQWNTSEGGRKEAMMIGRERASVEEGRVEGGRVAERNERGKEEREGGKLQRRSPDEGTGQVHNREAG